MTDEIYENDMTDRQKAMKHLETWTKKQLIFHLSLTSKDGWIEKWADEYDRHRKSQ